MAAPGRRSNFEQWFEVRTRGRYAGPVASRPTRPDGAAPRSVRPAPAPTRPALKVRYELRQSELVDAAAGVFADRGYDSTPVHELAQQIGLAAGGIYHYFGSKEQLLIAICDELVDPLLARARDLLEEQADATPEARLRALVAVWVAHVVDHRDHMLVFQQERHQIERGAQWEGVRRARKEFERLVEQVLADVVSGEDRRVVLSALLGMVNHTAQWFDPRGRLDAGDVADGYVALVLGG